MAFQAVFTKDTYTPDNLIAGNPDLLLNEAGILLSGQNLKRGALLGRITSGGKLVLSSSASSDGSQTPIGILVDDCDASAGDKATIIYTRGDFCADALTYGAAHTAASVATGLKAKNIYLITTQGGV